MSQSAPVHVKDNEKGWPKPHEANVPVAEDIDTAFLPGAQYHGFYLSLRGTSSMESDEMTTFYIVHYKLYKRVEPMHRGSALPPFWPAQIHHFPTIQRAGNATRIIPSPKYQFCN